MLGGIVLVTFINEQTEQGKSFRDAVCDGALLRLRSVLMTASVMILGLLPMLLSRGVGGRNPAAARDRRDRWTDQLNRIDAGAAAAEVPMGARHQS